MTIEMTQDADEALDEFILEVFEEQEEQFYFPVRSQKEARAFVKALHSKGLDYDSLGKEIDEFEHNFSAWRKGLGRVGIGTRMIERINRPLQEVLDSDEELKDENIKGRDNDEEAKHSHLEVPAQAAKSKAPPADAAVTSSKKVVSGKTDGVKACVNSVAGKADKVRNGEDVTKQPDVAVVVAATKKEEVSEKDKERKSATKKEEVNDKAKESRSETKKEEVSDKGKESKSATKKEEVNDKAKESKSETKKEEISEKGKESTSQSSASSSSESSSRTSPAFTRSATSREQNMERAAALRAKLELKMNAAEQRINNAIDRKRTDASAESRRRSQSPPESAETTGREAGHVGEQRSSRTPERRPVAASPDKADTTAAAPYADILRKKEDPDARLAGRSQRTDGEDAGSTEREKPTLDALLRKQDGAGSSFQRGEQDEKRRSVRERVSIFNELNGGRGSQSPRLGGSREGSANRHIPSGSDSGNSRSSSRSSSKESSPDLDAHGTAERVSSVRDIFERKSVERSTNGPRDDEATKRGNETEKGREVPVVAGELRKQAGEPVRKVKDVAAIIKEEPAKPTAEEERQLQESAEREFDSLIHDLEDETGCSGVSSASGSRPGSVGSGPPTAPSPSSPTSPSATKTAPLVTSEMLDLDDDSESDFFVDAEESVTDDDASDSQDESPSTTDTSDDDVDEEIDENYDSDFDAENKDDSGHLALLLKQLSAHKRQLLDGPGQLYVFTDSDPVEDVGAVARCKLGASRYPNKRLLQAKTLNVDMRMAASVRVNSRQVALREAVDKLESYKLTASEAWYKGPLDTIVGHVMSVAKRHPLNSSDC